MAVRVAEVHLADVPGHVGWRKSDIQASGRALPVNLVNVVHPDRHPRAFVGRLVSVRSKRGSVRPLASTALASLAKKDLALAGANRAESRRRAPVPAFFPAPFLEPGEAGDDVGDVQDRSNGLRVHGAEG